jgi:GNAT superfamily N-acetyltransferase
VVRDAGAGDIQPILGVYSACIAADPGYLPFVAPDDTLAILAWFRLKPLLACLVAELDDRIVGVAGLRDADPGPGAGEPGGRWLEACRLAVHPAHRGGALTRNLISARVSRAAALGADRLWMRCVENSPSHLLAVSHGWAGWARTEFEGPAAIQRAILLARPLDDYGCRDSPKVSVQAPVHLSVRRSSFLWARAAVAVGCSYS